MVFDVKTASDAYVTFLRNSPIRTFCPKKFAFESLVKPSNGSTPGKLLLA